MAESVSPPDGELNLPPALILHGINRLGPLRPARGRFTRVRPAGVAIPALGGSEPPTAQASATPLRGADGTSPAATLACRLEPAPPRLEVGVQGALAPGVYAGSVRMQVGETAASLPVEVRVAAWWPWLLGCLLLGLLSLGAAGFLTEQAALADRRTQVFELREELATLAERSGDPRAPDALAPAAAGALQGALEILAQPRPADLRDGRIPRADALIARARAGIAALVPPPALAAPGAAAVKQLTDDWTGARERIAALRAGLTVRETGPAPAAPDGAVDATLAALDRGLAEALVLPLADAIEGELALEVERVRTTAQTGAGDRAGQLARRTAQRIGIALGALLERADLTLILRDLGQEARGRLRLLRAALADPRLPPDLARRLNQDLDQATATLAKCPTLDGLQAFNSAILQTDLELLRAGAAALIADTETARAQMERETDIAPIEAALARLPSGADQATKQRGLGEILALWRERVKGFTGPRQAAMNTALDDLERHLAAWNPDGLSRAMQTLMAEWAAYGEERFAALQAAPLEAFCTRQAAATALSLSAHASALALSPPDPTLAGLAAELDGLAFRLAQTTQAARSPAGVAGCVGVLADLDGRAHQIGSQLFTAAILRSRLPPDLRLDAARRSGEAATITLMERLRSEPRPLTLHARTAPRDRVADHDLVFDIQGLDPAWGQAVRVQVDFGDGNRFETDALSLAQAGILTHRYTRPGTWPITLRADLVAGTAGANAPALGQGETQVQVAPSPVARARALADNLLSLRTALALVLALLIQGWRLAGRAPFGARGQDYLEAFAIGAGGQAGLDGLTILLKVGG